MLICGRTGAVTAPLAALAEATAPRPGATRMRAEMTEAVSTAVAQAPAYA